MLSLFGSQRNIEVLIGHFVCTLYSIAANAPGKEEQVHTHTRHGIEEIVLTFARTHGHVYKIIIIIFHGLKARMLTLENEDICCFNAELVRMAVVRVFDIRVVSISDLLTDIASCESKNGSQFF